jgi:glucosamine--fructose-6-phosphate aminotransferase (isomerizing)
MCGIVGYIGSEDAVTFLTPALKRLEYRGYDSAGLATMNGHGLEILKRTGKVSALEALVAAEPPHGKLGIAHTRWATHGRPSEANAHPHVDCHRRVAVVHNGIIENHRALRQRLMADGHRFQSQTDTEVIAHLIESHRRSPDVALPIAVRRAAAELRGSYAIACISEDDPDMIVAVRSGTSPLIVATHGPDAFLASDVPALLGRCDETMALEDGDIAVLRPGAVDISGLSGDRVTRAHARLTVDSAAMDKGGYPHYMLKEICEQPEVIARSLGTLFRTTPRRLAFRSGGLSADELRAVDRVSFLACGTSRHAGMVGEFLVESWGGIPADVVIASECRHRQAIYHPGVLAVPISQSGETADTLAALRQASHGGARTLAICNRAGSSLAREAQAVIDTCAGLEIGVAATKSFTTQVVAVTWLALQIAAARSALPRAQLHQIGLALRRAPALIAEILEGQEAIRRIAERFADVGHCLYLGRGLEYPLALEGALKLKEIAYVHAEGLAAGEMKHGPIALVDARTLVVALAPDGPAVESMVSTIQEVKARDGVVLAVATRGDRTVSELADEVIEIPPAPACLQPLLLAVPLQLLAYHVAALRGCDVDQPRNLAKSVTVE